jgi:hypothetical protein
VQVNSLWDRSFTVFSLLLQAVLDVSREPRVSGTPSVRSFILALSASGRSINRIPSLRNEIYLPLRDYEGSGPSSCSCFPDQPHLDSQGSPGRIIQGIGAWVKAPVQYQGEGKRAKSTLSAPGLVRSFVRELVSARGRMNKRICHLREKVKGVLKYGILKETDARCRMKDADYRSGRQGPTLRSKLRFSYLSFPSVLRLF